MYFSSSRVVALIAWFWISFQISAEAGDSGVFGSLHPYGPSFTGGIYEGYGLLYDRIEQDMLIIWGIGLLSFFMRPASVLLYLASIVAVQLFFISQVDDHLLWVTSFFILIPCELIFLIASYLWINSSFQINPRRDERN